MSVLSLSHIRRLAGHRRSVSGQGQWSSPEFVAICWHYLRSYFRLPDRKLLRARTGLEAIKKRLAVPFSGDVFFGFSDAAGIPALASTDVDATGVSPLAPSRLISRRGQAKSSARPAGAGKGSPLINNRAACASIVTDRDPGAPSN
jgi:hypothetical protein